MDPSFRIREASRRDLPAIAEAERICFSDPWSEAGLRELFQHETMLGLVADEKVGRGQLEMRIGRLCAGVAHVVAGINIERDGRPRAKIGDDLESFLEGLIDYMPAQCRIVISSRNLPRFPWMSLIRARRTGRGLRADRGLRRETAQLLERNLGAVAAAPAAAWGISSL